ncbi:MAG: bifunctional phosphoribosyl-AMP cyclohydrolase/phosphoribosyl-ATP diphosphatase HisIE [Clostridiales bacterium]|nr:bifunctional phosphoribosyl-AMP cyclohydrolase/phosphoribosyl-ATP diphosphatase HisIE [Clostridiales bacterium]
MIDRTIPYYNIIMRCDRVLPMEIKLPKGYSIRTYQPGDEDAWAAILCTVGEQTSLSDAKAEFTRRYLADAALTNRIFFAVDATGTAVGTAIAWYDGLRVLHWIAVHPEHQGKGIGRALCQTAMTLFRREDNNKPVYLHTQPWSWKAILLYISLGFKLQPRDTIYNYENQYAQAMETLKAIVTPEQYALMEANTAFVAADFDPASLKWNEAGLLPAIAQDAVTGEVLMLAWMNRQSLRLTLESGYATYFSRSRQQLWRKGESSGHTQRVIRLSYDCDGDTILMQVQQIGPACHTGKHSCFHNPVVDGDLPATAGILETIAATVADRAAHPQPGSYTNYLLDKGTEKICKKVGEEATEAVIAAMKTDADGLAGEVADLLYHLSVLLHDQGVAWQDVWEVLRKRHT